MATSQKEELKDRVTALRKRLQARIAEGRAEGRRAAREQADEAQERVDELGEILAKGWDDFTEDVARRLNRWVEKANDALAEKQS